MPILRLFKVGRSIALIIPKAIREELKVFQGDAVALNVADGALHVRPMETRAVPESPQAATDGRRRRNFQRGDE